MLENEEEAMKTTGEIEDEIKEQRRLAIERKIMPKVASMLQELRDKKVDVGWKSEEYSDHTCCKYDFQCVTARVDLQIRYNLGGWRCGDMSMRVYSDRSLVFETKSLSATAYNLDSGVGISIVCYRPGKWEEYLESEKIIQLFEQEKADKTTEQVRQAEGTEQARRDSAPPRELIEEAKRFDINCEEHIPNDSYVR